MVLAAALAGGCDASSPYRATLREQTKALEELARILESVTDKDSMRIARTKLVARFADFESVRERAQKLPQPTADIMQQVQAEGHNVREALQKVQEQVRRINNLPEGPEFLGSFEQMK